VQRAPIIRRGQTPFPTSPGSDLPTVLKSPYLQQHFTPFAIDAEGLSDAELHGRFGAFLSTVKPGHPPGEVRAPGEARDWASVFGDTPDSGGQRPHRPASAAAKPRKVKDYSADARKSWQDSNQQTNNYACRWMRRFATVSSEREAEHLMLA
jgi:hypothetical protein